jgi:hypothetical protein
LRGILQVSIDIFTFREKLKLRERREIMLKDKRGLDMPSKNSILRKMGKKASKPKPRCQGIFFCDNIIKDQETGKTTHK